MIPSSIILGTPLSREARKFFSVHPPYSPQILHILMVVHPPYGRGVRKSNSVHPPPPFPLSPSLSCPRGALFEYFSLKQESSQVRLSSQPGDNETLTWRRAKSHSNYAEIGGRSVKMIKGAVIKPNICCSLLHRSLTAELLHASSNLRHRRRLIYRCNCLTVLST